MSVVSKAWFKWGMIGVSIASTLSLFGFFILRDYLREKEREAIAAEERRIRIEYEGKFRNTMTRIYQNLKLDHFLAAYNNLEFLEAPQPNDRELAQEYIDVLYRIGRGLLDSNFLKESEAVFSMIRTYEGQVTPANIALTEIDSRRRVDTARVRIETADQLLKEAHYRDAFGEYQKADLELQSVKTMGFQNVDADLERLYTGFRVAKFYVSIADAEKKVSEAENMLKFRNFEKINAVMSEAASLISLAAFYRQQSPEAAQLRARLSAIDQEMSMIIPNEQPIWNTYKAEEATQYPGFFRLEEVEFTSKPDDEGQVRISLAYSRRSNDILFVVRYRIFFENGTSIFNGHFLASEPDIDTETVRKVSYLQELPERFRNRPIRRIEVKVYNDDQTIVSRVARAFRTGT